MNLLHRIGIACVSSGVTVSAFGRTAVNDPRLVSDLRRGREPRGKTLRRIESTLAMMEAGRGN